MSTTINLSLTTLSSIINFKNIIISKYRRIIQKNYIKLKEVLVTYVAKKISPSFQTLSVNISTAKTVGPILSKKISIIIAYSSIV
jgi:dihydroneopterin aldolase